MNWLGSRSKFVLRVIFCLVLITIMSPVFASTAARKIKVYQPKIFNAHEFQTLKVVTETILRDDEMPGAREAKANEFIDFQIKYDPELQERFQDGLLWLDRHSRRLHGRNFVQLKTEERRDIIQCLEVKAKYRDGEERGREFFELAKRYTYMGFYASEEALRAAIPAAPKLEPIKRRRVAGSAEEERATAN